MVVRQFQDQYKASYDFSVLSSEDLVSKITGESPKKLSFQDLYSSIAQLDISNLSQKTIQHALDNEKFHGLKENLACERESARLLSLSVRHAGAWLPAPPIQALGFIWHQMSVELVQSTGWVSLSTTPKGSAGSVKQEFLTSMGIMPFRVTVEETQNIVSTTITAQKWESHLFPLQLKSLVGYRQPSRKHSSGWLLNDNCSFQAQGLSVAFCKLMQSLSITAIRGSAEMLLARAP